MVRGGSVPITVQLNTLGDLCKAELGWSPHPFPIVRTGKSNGSPPSAHGSQQEGAVVMPSAMQSCSCQEMRWQEDVLIWMGPWKYPHD